MGPQGNGLLNLLVEKLPSWLIAFAVVGAFVLFVLSYLSGRPWVIGEYRVGISSQDGEKQLGELVAAQNTWHGVFATPVEGIRSEDIFLSVSDKGIAEGGSTAVLRNGRKSWVQVGYQKGDIVALAYKSNEDPAGIGVYLLEYKQRDLYVGRWEGHSYGRLVTCPYVLSKDNPRSTKARYREYLSAGCQDVLWEAPPSRLPLYRVQFSYRDYLSDWISFQRDTDRTCILAYADTGEIPSEPCKRVIEEYRHQSRYVGSSGNGTLYLEQKSNRDVEGHLIYRFPVEQSSSVFQVHGTANEDGEMRLTFWQPSRYVPGKHQVIARGNLSFRVSLKMDRRTNLLRGELPHPQYKRGRELLVLGSVELLQLRTL